MTEIADRVYRSLLVLRCQAGDRAAFEELVASYQQRLRYFLRKMLRDTQSADDLLQDVWIAVFRGVGRLADPAAFPAWLYQVARRQVCRALRKRRQPHYPLEEIDLAEDDREEDFSAEDAERVHAALEQIAPEHREVLLLRFMEEMPYEDIARVIGCQVGTVRSRLHYAKHALRRVIERTVPHE
ncbi:MAG TPA: sigma-70 family RNA polymerase sigma factor [Gemmataceae bacterium]|nr:sigma-70 family RNA polymerase sigma factor [Gemmataceae bacterium]